MTTTIRLESMHDDQLATVTGAGPSKSPYPTPSHTSPGLPPQWHRWDGGFGKWWPEPRTPWRDPGFAPHYPAPRWPTYPRFPPYFGRFY